MRIPLLHIVDPVGEAVAEKGLKKVGLLGTGYTMGKPFYRERLSERFGVEALVPDEAARRDLHNIIFGELCVGVVREESRVRFLEVIETLRTRGARAIILACTELPMILHQEEVDVPLFDSARLHVGKAVEMAMGE